MLRSTRERADCLSLTLLQKEASNVEQVPAVLAGHGHDCVFLTDRRGCADFVARHRSSGTDRRALRTARCLVDRTYANQGLWITFPAEEDWYFLEHDTLRDVVGENTAAHTSKSWTKGRCYARPTPSADLLRAVEPYRLDQSLDVVIGGWPGRGRKWTNQRHAGFVISALAL